MFIIVLMLFSILKLWSNLFYYIILTHISVFPDLDLTQGLNRSDFDAILYASVDYYLQKLPDIDRTDDMYQAFRFYYADWPYFDDPIRNRDMLAQV